VGSLTEATHYPAGYMIDDLEDGDGMLLEYTPDEWEEWLWRGRWYDLHANTFLSPEPVVGGRGGSAMHLQGSGSQIEGGFGFDFGNYAAVTCATDCQPATYMANRRVSDWGPFESATGIAFWARSGSGPAVVRFSLLTPGTVAEAFGGSCTDACGLYLGRDIAVDAAWRHFAIQFDTLTQLVSTGALLEDFLAVEFGTAEATLDLWVDEVGFFRCAGTDCGSCDDGLANGAETGRDCGGNECGPCGDGAECGARADCWTECYLNVCGSCYPLQNCTPM
jgi:hypothetical protein